MDSRNNFTGYKCLTESFPNWNIIASAATPVIRIQEVRIFVGAPDNLFLVLFSTPDEQYLKSYQHFLRLSRTVNHLIHGQRF
jgi:predicted ABC-type exoprotein transport system permease subunit